MESPIHSNLLKNPIHSNEFLARATKNMARGLRKCIVKDAFCRAARISLQTFCSGVICYLVLLNSWNTTPQVFPSSAVRIFFLLENHNFSVQVNSLKLNTKRDVLLVNPVLPCQGCRYLKTEYSFMNMQIRDKSEINIGDLLCKGERSMVSALL